MEREFPGRICLPGLRTQDEGIPPGSPAPSPSPEGSAVAARGDLELQAVYDAAPVMICLIDEGHRILFGNRAYRSFTHTGEADPPGGRLADIVACIQAAADPRGCGLGPLCVECTLRLAIADTFRTGTPHFDVEYRTTIGGAGQRREVVLLASTSLIDRTPPGRLVLCLQDITERVRVEEELRGSEKALRESREELRSILSSIEDLVFSFDLEGRITGFYGPTSADLYVPSEQFLGRRFEEVLPPEVGEVFARATAAVAASSRSEQFDYELLLGERRTWWSATVSPRRGPDGVLAGFTLVSRNITGRKETEEALHRQEERWRAVVETSPDPIVISSLDGTILESSEATRRLHGYERLEEVAGRNLLEWVDPAYRGEATALIGDVAAGKRIEPREILIVREDGTRLWVEANAGLLREADGTPSRVVVVERDITARRAVEERLRASEERYRALVETSPDAVIVVGLDGRLLFANRSAVSIFGVGSPEEAVGRSIFDFVAPEDRAVLVGRFAGVVGGTPGLQMRYTAVRSDGTRFPIEASSSAIRGPSGLPEGLLAAIRDDSLRSKMEGDLVVLKEAAEAANRAKSAFLANMSHEIRTPLNGVLGMLGLLLETDLDVTQRRYANSARTSGDALLSLVGDILDLSKIEAGKVELDEVDFGVHALLDDICAALSLAARQQRLALRCSVGPEIPPRVRGDRRLLRQVLVNLVGNAVKFTPSGEVEVRVEKVSGGPEETRVRFWVRDTGIGIPEEKIGSLFKVFSQVDVSTTRRYGGTGLGLAICSQIVGLMGGEIGVTSRVGEGSEFWFAVPLKESSVGGDTRSSRDGPVRNGVPIPNYGGSRVLLAEDNPVNQEVARTLLTRLGADVDLATNGVEAVDLLRKGRYDLVLMDVQMPEMDGLEATATIRDPRSGVLDSAVPIVAMTAHTMREDREACLRAGMDDFLTKPIYPDALIAVLDRHLPNRRGGNTTL